MDKMDRKRAEVNIAKAKAIIAEKEFAILDREEDIERLRISIGKQEKIIKEQGLKLQEAQDV